MPAGVGYEPTPCRIASQAFIAPQPEIARPLSHGGRSPQRVIPFEFRHDLWHQKTRIMGLSCGVVCVNLRLAILIQYRSVTDTQTDRHTHRHTTMAYTVLSIASRGKNH